MIRTARPHIYGRKCPLVLLTSGILSTSFAPRLPITGKKPSLADPLDARHLRIAVHG